MVDVFKWYEDNFLHANPDKYRVLTLSSAKTRRKDIEVKVNGVDIEQSTSLSLLGGTIDDQLSFSEHISNACKKASQKIGVLVRLRNLIPQETKLTLYKMLILPNLTYSRMVLHFCKQSDKRKLERLQERALRAVFKTKQAPMKSFW